MPEGSVTVTTVVEVDPPTAFRIFTEETDRWWKRGPRYRFRTEENGTLRFEPGVGGRLVEVYDEECGDHFEVGRILVWEPGSRLVFEFRAREFRPGEKTEVEVRFEESARGTRLTVEHRGWKHLHPGHPARHGLTGPAFDSLIGGWWAEQFVSLQRRSLR